MLNTNSNQVVVLTQADLQAILDEQRRMMEDMLKAPRSSDISSDGEAIPTVMCDGVRYLTRKDTAKLLGKSYPTLFRYNRDGILKGIKLGPRSVYYRYDDVRAMMAGA